MKTSCIGNNIAGVEVWKKSRGTHGTALDGEVVRRAARVADHHFWWDRERRSLHSTGTETTLIEP